MDHLDDVVARILRPSQLREILIMTETDYDHPFPEELVVNMAKHVEIGELHEFLEEFHAKRTIEEIRELGEMSGHLHENADYIASTTNTYGYLAGVHGEELVYPLFEIHEEFASEIFDVEDVSDGHRRWLIIEK